MTAKKTKSMLTRTLLSVTLLIGMAPALAEVDSVVKSARELLDKNQAKQAFDLLEPLEAARAGDPDFDTVMGIAANETAQYTRAVFALERVLSVQPENSRARAELGRALFAVGDLPSARQVLLDTKKGNIPTEAASTIDQFLRAIDRAEEAARSSIRTYIEASVGYDTNINAGPGNANIAVPAFGGLILTLNNAAVATKDSFATLGAGLYARYVVDPRWSLIGSFSGNGRGNQTSANSVFNNLQFDGNFGASYRYDKHEFSGVVQAGSFDLNGSRARNQAGVVGEWAFKIDGVRQISSYLQWGTLSYPGQAVRDVNRGVIGTSYAHSFSNEFLGYAGVYVGSEKEKNSAFPQVGHKLYGARVGAQQEITPFVAAFANLSFENRKFNGADPLFLVTRNDDQFNLNLGLNWVPAKLWRVTPQLSLTSVKSNVAISDFKRDMFSITVRRDF
jgi:tetratricopeptide (TPR) repeat protein